MTRWITPSTLLLAGVLVLTLRITSWWVGQEASPVCIDSTRDVTLEIEEVKKRRDGSVLLAAMIRRIEGDCEPLKNARVRVSWFRPALNLLPGQQLQAEVRLRTPWGTANPGGFDYRRWLLGRNYAATGYIKTVYHQTQSLTPADTRYDGYLHGGMLKALASGEKSGISDDTWALLRATGTVHLMVISGLHVGVFSALVHAFVALIARPLTPWLPCLPRTCGLCGAGLAVLLLVIYTGADPPVVRAGAMVITFCVCTLTCRRLAWWRCLLLVGGIAIFVQPGVLWRHGFWLSYAAVASLLWLYGQDWRALSKVRAMIGAQLGLALLMASVLGLTVGEQPLIAPLANLLTVPVISALTVPAVIGGSVFSSAQWLAGPAGLLLAVADFSLFVVLDLLKRLVGWLPNLGYQNGTLLLLSAAAAVLLVLPLERRLRWLCTYACITLLAPNDSGVRQGHFRVIVLDVGQGSAALVDTAHHRLVVDTGPAFASGFSMGQAVVLPALAATGPRRLDGYVQSHADNDHAGGADAVETAFPALLMHPCDDGANWHWDGVTFTLLRLVAESRNDASCTVLVSNGQSHVFLSGDVGRHIEKRLLPRLPAGIDLLVAPHHGSRTSSSSAFVSQLAPLHTIFSAGRDNRYGHPHPEVIDRYNKIGSRLWQTGINGALVWKSEDGQVRSER